MARETGVQHQVESYEKTQKWYLRPPCLTLSIIRYGSRVKWSNQGRQVTPSPTPRCSSLWKGSLRVSHDYGHQHYLLYLLYRCITCTLRMFKHYKALQVHYMCSSITSALHVYYWCITRACALYVHYMHIACVQHVHHHHKCTTCALYEYRCCMCISCA